MLLKTKIYFAGSCNCSAVNFYLDFKRAWSQIANEKWCVDIVGIPICQALKVFAQAMRKSSGSDFIGPADLRLSQDFDQTKIFILGENRPTLIKTTNTIKGCRPHQNI